MNRSGMWVRCVFLNVLVATAAGQDGAEVLRQAGIQGGVVVLLGCGDGALAAQLAAGPQYVVQGLDIDPANVAAARQRLLAAGHYGAVTIDRWDGRKCRTSAIS